MNQSQVHTYRQYNRVATYCVVAVTLIFLGCQSGERQPDETSEPGIPEHIDTLENLTVFSPDEQTPDTVELVREQVFESNEEVYIQGYTRDVAVDNRDRVFIVGSVPGKVGIYVFEPDGTYITTIGKYGKGPGEFLSIGSVKILNDELHVYDSHQQKFSVFSLNSLSLSYEELLKKDKVKGDKQLSVLNSGSDFLLREDKNYLMKFMFTVFSNENRNVFYYRVSEDGTILPERILELQRFKFVISKKRQTSDGVLYPFTMPYSRSALVAASEKSPIYTAWTEDFLIKVHDDNGTYRRAIYYPVQKSSLSLAGINISNTMEKAISDQNLPDTWPALHTMEVDDKNRLWVSTIAESDSTFQWWVLDQEGKLLARFTLPGERSSRSIISKPMYVIKNGYFYTRERDIPAGIDRIIKHKIVFRER